ncbi:MAG TPA: hypothetical protein DCM73_13790 [Clostridiales bacterium]|nr:hypothetical protein [Clostridiales bacterium]
MKKTVSKKLLLTFTAILILRYIYVAVIKEPYINGVFISTTLGLLIATAIIAIVFYKRSTK